MANFDWHKDRITRATPIISSYRNTQNVRRFFKTECGSHFKFNRPFMAWLPETALPFSSPAELCLMLIEM